MRATSDKLVSRPKLPPAGAATIGGGIYELRKGDL